MVDLFWFKCKKLNKTFLFCFPKVICKLSPKNTCLISIAKKCSLKTYHGCVNLLKAFPLARFFILKLWTMGQFFSSPKSNFLNVFFEWKKRFSFPRNWIKITVDRLTRNFSFKKNDYCIAEIGLFKPFFNCFSLVELYNNPFLKDLFT